MFSPNSQVNTFVGISFQITLKACRFQLIKETGIFGIFLWILQNFSKHLFVRLSANGCFFKVGFAKFLIIPKYLFKPQTKFMQQNFLLIKLPLLSHIFECFFLVCKNNLYNTFHKNSFQRMKCLSVKGNYSSNLPNQI